MEPGKSVHLFSEAFGMRRTAREHESQTAQPLRPRGAERPPRPSTPARRYVLVSQFVGD